jgi:hypothetical protein
VSLTDDEVRRVLDHLAREEYQHKEAAAQNKPSFLRWLGGVGLRYIAIKIGQWTWRTIKVHFGLPPTPDALERAAVRWIERTWRDVWGL